MKKLKFIHLLFFIVLISGCSKDDDTLITDQQEQQDSQNDNNNPNNPVILNIDPNAIPGFAYGTMYEVADIISTEDPSTYVSTTYEGRAMRTIYDRRVLGNITVNAYIFKSIFSDGYTVESQVNPEFGSEVAARIPVEQHAFVLGQMPRTLRAPVNEFWIHQADETYGAQDGHVIIYSERTPAFLSFNALEEAMLHELVHAAIDESINTSQDWILAQNADNNFISMYAKNNPEVEDVAESFVAYFAVRYREDLVGAYEKNVIINTIPNRISYFDQLTIDIFPLN